MTHQEKLNGVDYWAEAIGEAWSRKWAQAVVNDEHYTWTILYIELRMSGLRMDCQYQQFLSEIAQIRAASAETLKVA